MRTIEAHAPALGETLDGRPEHDGTVYDIQGVDTHNVEVVVPVYNEEAELEASVRRLRRYLDNAFPFPAVVTVADNASTDGTWAIASRLAREVPGVKAIRLEEKGRGRALRAAWSASAAEVVAYMDVDLATDLGAFLPLVAPLFSGHSDVAIGSRLAHGAHVVRGPKREVISRGYNLVVHAALRNGFSDAQCGFKALRSEVARALLPLVQDDRWFFDTELLVLAERSGLRIHEVPVDWVDDPDSRVDIRRTAIDDLRGIWRLMRRRVTSPWAERRCSAPDSRRADMGPGRLARHFVGVGTVSTLAYLLLFVVLRGALGPYAANAAALAACTVVNTTVHGRITFGGASRIGPSTLLLGAGAVLATTLSLTSVALLVARALAPASTIAQVSALIAATAGAALARFIVMRAWIFRAHLRRQSAASAARLR